MQYHEWVILLVIEIYKKTTCKSGFFVYTVDMNKKDFLKYFKLVEKMLKDNDKKQNAIEALCVGSYPVYNGNHAFEYIKLLAYAVGDKSEWIEWYAAENDMGKGKLKVTLKDSKTELLIDTPSKLYDIIKTI